MADWSRLAKYVTARRVALGFSSRDSLAAQAQLSPRTLADIETGRRDRYHPSTIAALERAMRWKQGSVFATVAGGEPTVAMAGDPMPTAMYDREFLELLQSPDEPLIKVIRDPQLSDEQKARIIRTLIAEQERFARARVNELIRDALADE